MPDNPDAKKEENSQSSKNIQIPPIPKQTAGAVVGAAAGSIAARKSWVRILPLCVVVLALAARHSH